MKAYQYFADTERITLKDYSYSGGGGTVRRNTDTLIRRIREELRADGPDGAGYSDFIIIDAINSALDDLSGIFTIRDTVEFTTRAGENTYNLAEETGVEIVDIIRIEYDGNKTSGKRIDPYLDLTVSTEGPVREWFLWGKSITFVGEVEDNKTVRLWITRAPKKINTRDDVPELPGYADEAIVAYAVSVCYRESKDYDRANYHYSIYLGQKNELLRRGIPQGQKDGLSVMRDSYMGPFRPYLWRGYVRTDKNPGGR